MPYQDRHPLEGSDVEAAPTLSAAANAPETAASNARTIQIVIVVGLVGAIIVAIFGSY